MEEKIIPLRERLKYMVGSRFGLDPIRRSGEIVGRGWYFFLGFYWFCICFYKRWELGLNDSYITGWSFAYKPNPNPDYGSLLWLKDKKHLRHEYPEEIFDAKKVQTARREHER